MTSPGVGSGALLAAWFFLATNSLRSSLGRVVGTTSFVFIRGSLSPTRHPESYHREPSFRNLMLTRATDKSNHSRSTQTDRTLQGAAHRDFCSAWLTSKMSHDRGWRAACLVTIWIPWLHFETPEVARGVTAMVVGSGALLGLSFMCE